MREDQSSHGMIDDSRSVASSRGGLGLGFGKKKTEHEHNSEEEEDIPMEELSRIEQKRRLIKIDMLNKQKLEDVKEEIDKNKVEEKVPAKKRNIKEIIEETKKKFEARERELAEAGDGMGSAGQNQAYNKAFPSNARFINAEI